MIMEILISLINKKYLNMQLSTMHMEEIIFKLQYVSLTTRIFRCRQEASLWIYNIFRQDRNEKLFEANVIKS